MPFGIVLIVLAAIVFGTVMIGTIVSAVFKFLSSRDALEAAPQSLTTSELQGLIEDAVAEAIQPLAERVEALEQRLTTEALPPARLDMLEAADGYEAAPKVSTVPKQESIH